jgi:signal peptidase I
MDLEEIKTKIRTNFKPFMKETIETIVFVVVMVIIIRFFIGEIRWIPSGSMKPTLIEKDRIFVERFRRFYKTPERGDVMVFYPPNTELKMDFLSVFERLTGFFCKDIAYIKRVVGLPGDTVEIVREADGRSYVKINGKEYKEDYILDEYDYIPCMKDMYCGPFVLPEGKYFMLGDNRGNSQDGRFWGFLDENRFVGKAEFLFWPVMRMKKL